MAKYKAYKLPSGKELRFPPNSSNEQIRNYIVSNYGEQALRPAPSVMTDEQRQEARELAKQYEQPKSFGDKVSEWAVTSPLGRGIGLGLQGVANSYLNPAGYVARGMGMDTKPLEPQNTTERVIEAGSGALYDTAMFMPVGKAIGSSQLVGNLANNSNKALSMAGKGIKALATPAAPAYELASGVGGASLPAAVNLQAPSEDASFGDKAKYYAANTVLALLGGLGGAGIVGGGRALAKQGLNKYGVNADGSLDLDLPKETVKPKNSAEVLAEEGVKPVEVAKEVTETPVAPLSKSAEEQAKANFDRWYEGSKVVDENGRPLVVYHGTNADFDAFDPQMIGKATDNGFYGKGFYFTRNKGEASSYGNKVLPFYLKSKNMFDIRGVDGGYYGGLKDNMFEKGANLLDDLGLLDADQVEKYNFYKEAKNNFLKNVDIHEPSDVQDVWFGELTMPDGTKILNRAWESDNTRDGVLNVLWNDYARRIKYKDGTYLDHLLDGMSLKDYMRSDGINPQRFSDKLKSMGYDGIYQGDEFVVFEPNQIKSVNNSGGWTDSPSLTDPDWKPEPILHQAPIPEELPQIPLNPEKGISRLTSKERLAQNPNLSAEAKANLRDSATYDILHNQDLTMQAIADVNANPDMVRNSLLEKDFYTAQDFEDARLLASRLFSEGKTEDALTLIRTVSQKGSKAGQSVQAMSLWSKMTPEGAVRNAQKMVDEYNALHPKNPIELTPEQTKKIMELQTKVLSLPDGSREKDVYTALSLKAQEEMIPTSLGDKVRSYRNQSMLLNPKTLGRNILGNMSFASVEKGLTDPVAAMIDKGLSKFTGQRTRAMPQYGEYFSGLGKGAKYGAEDVNLGINTRKLGGRFDSGQRPAFDGGVLGKTEKALAYGLQVPDRAFYEATYAESLANQMKAKGVNKATKEMENIAEQEALEAVFQNKGLISDTVNKFRGGLNKLSKDGLEVAGIRLSDGSLGLGDMLIPYAQTPANLTQQAINYSPLGAIKGFGNLAKGNQRQASKDLARSIVGTGGIGAGYTLAKEGLLTGDLNPENLSTKDAMERRRNLELMGIRPNQIQIGDTGYSYGFLNPVSTMLSAGAKLEEGGDTLDATLSAGATLADLPFLSNVNKFHRDLVYQGMGDAIKNQAAGLPSQFIPTLSSQTADMFDDTVKETYDPNTFKQGLNVAINKIPFARDVLPDRIDVTGQPMDKYSSVGMSKLFDAYVNPTFVNERKDNPIAQELERLYQTTGESKQFLPLADRKIRQDGGQRQLEPNEYVDYQRDLGQTNALVMGDLIKAPYYNKLTDTQKVDLISYAQKETNKNIKEGLFEGKDLVKEVLDKVEKRVESTMLKPIKKVTSINAQKRANEVINKNHR
jgi:hypothetical protein